MVRAPWAQALVLFVATITLVGCAPRGHAPIILIEPPEFDLLRRQTLPGIGAGQGVAVRDGFVYVFGDADTGVLREYTLGDDDLGPRLDFTGREIRMTVDGVDTLPHPTGLAFHPDFPSLLGDTVSNVGTLFWVDFDRALDDGTLDNAVIARVDDDLASDGCRPEFMRYRGRWVVATSDHNATPNGFRLYDPRALRSATRSSDPGVLVDAWTCTPFVQSIRWTGQEGRCVLVQNQVRGLRYRLTWTTLDPRSERLSGDVQDLPEPDDELEGFVLLRDDLALFISAMRENNATFARVTRGAE